MRRAAFCLLLAGCNPTFPQPPSLVTAPRVLAVRGDPAEARPGARVDYRLLIATPNGSDTAPDARWAYCNVPKPLDENNIIAAGCLSDGAGIQSIGEGATTSAPVPDKACAVFGPDPPPQMPGQPPLRPRDPDVTGGYYQPVRVEVDGVTAFGLERITCNLANAGAAIAVQYAQSYTPNQNPTLLPLSSSPALPLAPLDLTTGAMPSPAPQVHAGAKLTLTASWPADSAEEYPVYDLTQLALVPTRESLRVSWFATAGAFAHDNTGRGSDELDTTTDNEWTAPTAPGPVHLWLVLRDSRGGVDFAAYDLEVIP